jgi:CheY-like chemotaxis protein
MQTTIFEPFVQVATRISERHEGAGLGLAIARRLVNLMGGTLTVQSEQGIGSVFRLQLPLTPPRRPVVEEASAVVPDDDGFAEQHPMDILVVEDDSINRKLILTLLRKLGYEPRSASNGLEAVSAYEERSPDLILMDIYMPHMDGYDATKRIREIEAEKDISGTFIAAITANTVPTDRDRCLAFDMNEHLSKPIKRDAVLKILQQAFRHIKHLH